MAGGKKEKGKKKERKARQRKGEGNSGNKIKNKIVNRMKGVVFLAALLGSALCVTLQKVVLPGDTTTFYERITEDKQGMSVDINIVGEQSLMFRCGKTRDVERAGFREVVGRYKHNAEMLEKGEYVVMVKNGNDKPVNFAINCYVDKARDEDDAAEVLRKILDKLRVDLTNLYNENLNLKDYKTTGLIKAKKTKKFLWVLTFLPTFYIVLGVIKLQIVKGFFSSKKGKKI